MKPALTDQEWAVGRWSGHPAPFPTSETFAEFFPDGVTDDDRVVPEIIAGYQ